MKTEFIYQIKAVIDMTGSLETLNQKLLDLGAGFTLNAKTREPVSIANMVITLDTKDGFPITGDLEEVLEKTREVFIESFGRHDVVLSDVSFDLISQTEIKGEEI